MALASAVKLGTSHLLYFGFDSLLHWAHHYPAELRSTVRRIPEHDLTIIGRTRRALDSHPRSQRDTEILANEAFARLTGHN